MKTRTRLVALFLALIMMISCAPISIWAADTATLNNESTLYNGVLNPIADTYISAANKNAVYGSEKTLYIDNQRTYLATFKTSDLDGANKAFLNLPVTGENSQTLSVYLLDGFEVDESATCYNNTPALSEGKIIGTYKVSEGDSKLDLLGIAAMAKAEYFTLAISGSAHYYEENFESYNGTTIVANS